MECISMHGLDKSVDLKNSYTALPSWSVLRSSCLSVASTSLSGRNTFAGAKQRITTTRASSDLTGVTWCSISLP